MSGTRFSGILAFALTTLLVSGCGKSVSKDGVKFPQVDQVVVLGPIAFADRQAIPYSGMSPSQLDTICVDLTGQNLSTIQSTLDGNAAQVGLSFSDISYWYGQYSLNDRDYVNQCLSGAFPKTFTSVRTGVSHTVANYNDCRTVTSNLVAIDYVNYLRNGGSPVMIAAKLKPTGCIGGVGPFVGRIQSAHGSFIDDYRSIPMQYP